MSDYQIRVNNLTTSTVTEEYLCLAAQINYSTPNRQNIVSLLCDLPDLSTSNLEPGNVFFVAEEGINVINTENEWLRLDGYSIRCDFEVRSLWSWGANASGQLGIGTTSGYEITPTREYTNSVNWCQLTAGTFNTGAVKTDGTLWAWGLGSTGRIGDGNNINQCSPVQEFYSDTTWCQVANNSSHNLAIKTGGTLWGWGTGTSGRLGDGTNTTRCSPVQEFCSDTTWSQASAGCLHSSAVKTGGTLWTWGCGSVGILGDGNIVNSCSPVQEFCSDTTWCQVAAGCTHTVAIKTGGTLWSWGCGLCGVLGDGTVVNKCSPVQEISGDTTWCQVNAGRIATSALKSGGTLWSWGLGIGGRLGDGTNTARCSPVQEICSDTTWCQVKSSDYATTAAIKTDSTLWTWGSQRCGISLTGVATFAGICSPTQEYTSDTNWCFVSLGCFHGTGIKFSG